mmetsp:Transcript_12199/g.22865  ORF Transcript_12199/g.22865 Transcript_12199/m.22865 type:complete len:195 (-) Transcript_12199:114-698(-)
MWRVFITAALTASLVESSRDEEGVQEAATSANHGRLDRHSHVSQTSLSTDALVATKHVLEGKAAKARERFRNKMKRVKPDVSPHFASCDEQWARYELGVKKDMSSLLEGMQRIRKSWALVEQAQMMGYTKLFAGTQRTDSEAANNMATGMHTARQLLQNMDELGETYRDRMETMLSAEQRAKFASRCKEGFEEE